MAGTKIYTGFTIIYLFLFLATLIPGYLFLFLFQPAYFFKLDLIRLTVIALSITLPIITINLAHLLKIYQTESNNYNFINAVYRAELISVIVLYIPLVIGYFMKWNLVAGVGAMIITQVIMSLVLVFAKVKEE